MDILGLSELVKALCLTLTNLPFVIALTKEKKSSLHEYNILFGVLENNHEKKGNS